jgi:D-alanyl-D-alanine endopeptidase (penicillin-binding protein 7)
VGHHLGGRPTALLLCWGSLTALASATFAQGARPDDTPVDRALVWQQAALPGIGVPWTVPSHRYMRDWSSDSTAPREPEYVHSSPRRVSSYLLPHECIVEPDSGAAPDASTRELLAQLRAQPLDVVPVFNVAKSAQPRPDSDPISVISDASPEAAPAPSIAQLETHGPDHAPGEQPEAAAAASIAKLEIKEPDQASPERAARLRLTSAAALVVDQEEGNLLYAKNPGAVRSIASITKLMTAMVALDAGLPLDERLTVQLADVRISKGKGSRLKVGVSLTRREMLKLALMSSENRAAAALARTYPGGPSAFVQAMNKKAEGLEMNDTRFLEPTGLDSGNVSTAHDLALMVNAAYSYPLIREFTTSDLHEVPAVDRRHRPTVTYHNSNGLVRDSRWDVGLSKTGYIGKAGRCLVMQATIAAKPVIIVLLDSLGKVSRVADANRIKNWLEGLAVTTPVAMRDKPRM